MLELMSGTRHWVTQSRSCHIFTMTLTESDFLINVPNSGQNENYEMTFSLQRAVGGELADEHYYAHK